MNDGDPAPGAMTWRVLLPVGLGTALSLMGDATLYTVLPTHTAEAGVTLASLGLLLSANRFVRLGLNGPVGWLTDRWPRRRVFIPALFCGALSTALYAGVEGVWPWLAARLLWGLAWSGIWIAGNALVLDLTTWQYRGRLLGLYNAAFFAGSATGSLLGGWLTDQIGFRPTLTVAAALTLLGALLAWLWLPETAPRSDGSRAVGKPPLPPGLPPVPAVTPAVAEPAAAVDPVPGRELLSAVALLGVNRLVIPGCLVPTFGLLLSRSLGDGVIFLGRPVGIATLTGLGLSLTTVLALVVIPLAGGLSDRLGRRWLVAAGGLLPGAAGFLLLALASTWSIPLGLVLVAATNGSNQGLATTLVGDLARQRQRGLSFGLLFTAGDLASALGPLLIFPGLRLVSLGAIYVGAGAILGLMLALALYWARRPAAEAKTRS